MSYGGPQQARGRKLEPAGWDRKLEPAGRDRKRAVQAALCRNLESSRRRGSWGRRSGVGPGAAGMTWRAAPDPAPDCPELAFAPERCPLMPAWLHPHPQPQGVLRGLCPRRPSVSHDPLHFLSVPCDSVPGAAWSTPGRERPGVGSRDSR